MKANVTPLLEQRIHWISAFFPIGIQMSAPIARRLRFTQEGNSKNTGRRVITWQSHVSPSYLVQFFFFPKQPLNLPHGELSIKQDCWRGPLPWWPQKPPKVELQTVPRACVYYVRGGFHPENCTGCFSGPDRVNSSSCALPAGEACIYVCVCTSAGVHVWVCVLGISAGLCLRARSWMCLWVGRGGGVDGAGHTKSSAKVIQTWRQLKKKKKKKKKRRRRNVWLTE